MAAVRFLHAADIHLDSPLTGLSRYPGAPVAELRTATRRAFAALVDRAIEEPVDFVVIAGDLYDGSWKDFNTGLFFAHQMGRLRSARIRAFVLHGNHDAESEITRTLKLPDNVHVLSSRAPQTVRVEDLRVAIHGQSFREPAVSANLAVAYPDAVAGWLNVGVLHTALSGRPPHEPYAPCSADDLRARGYQYWALGHVHEHAVVAERAPWIVFPGNLQGRHARETGPRGAMLVTAEGAEIRDVSRVVLDVLRWEHLRVDATGCAALSELLARAEIVLRRALDAAEGRPVAARVTIEGSTRLHGELFGREGDVRQNVLATSEGLGSGAIWIEKVRVETVPAAGEAAPLARADALSELSAIVDEAGHDDEFLGRLRADLEAIFDKLPPEVRASEGFALEALRSRKTDALLRQVTAGLVARISDSGSS